MLPLSPRFGPMALLATCRLGRSRLALCVAMAIVGHVSSVNAQFGPAETDATPFAEVQPTAAQIGSGAEAVPEVPPPPTFRRPEAVVGLPPAAEPAVFLKSATGRYTLLAGRGNGLGMDMLDGAASLGFRELSNLTVTPSAGVVFVDGPIRTDLPPRLYTAQLELQWFGQIATPVFYELAFLPALFTDGDNTGSDALRLQGRGVGYLAFSEQTQLVLGATYLDRKDVPILPIFGLMHAPSDDLKLELVFPRPRIRGRVADDMRSETWAYVAGELGGGSWAIERQNGRDDIASYRDLRVLVGVEQKQLEGWSAAVEAGYVFGRRLEYDRGRGDYSPDETFLLRVALSH
jgi:hypothetical protein